MRILLIENDFSIGRKLKNLLEKNRYTVDVATVPGDALCYGPSSPFHLIIFGVSSTVPDKHSLSTLAELRQNRIATPLLYLCSTDAIEERIQALNTGADDCLQLCPQRISRSCPGLRATEQLLHSRTSDPRKHDAGLLTIPALCLREPDPPQQQGISADGIIFPLSQ